MIAECLETVTQEHAVRVEENLEQPLTAMMALRELYELLEDYAPVWYSEEAHYRARAALGQRTVH